MRIRCLRSGGFAGLRQSFEVNTDSLSPPESRKVQALVESAGFFNLPERILRSGRGADQFSYIITIEQSGKTHTVEADESVIPPALKPLIRYLTAQGKK